MADNSSIPVDDTPTRSLSAESLIERKGTIPFLGTTDDGDTTYPDAVTPADARFADDDPHTFKAALQILPQAATGSLWADNEFVIEEDGDTHVDRKALTNVPGITVAEIESQTGHDIDTLIDRAPAASKIPITTHSDIIDRRRLALRTLGFDCKFRWQIATDRYTPGNVRAFFNKKIEACQRHDASDAFGWIRHYDWGGAVSITTIYPSKSHTIDPPSETAIDLFQDELVIGGDTDTATEANSETTIYYGDQMGYDFRGQQTLWASPTVYVPDVDAMIPLPYSKDFSRKHTGNIMNEALSWHEHILSELDELSTTVNTEIQRARLVATDFDALAFNVEDFYRYIGIHNDDIVSRAADRATTLAEPSTQPTLWNLQLSLKLALLDAYNGNKASTTYRQYQELAGEILRHPAAMITNATEQHRIETDTAPDGDPATTPPDQTTLADCLNDVVELSGITENSLDATKAEKVEHRVQQRLPDD